MHTEDLITLESGKLNAEELKKRNGLAARKPHIAKKLANISLMEQRGEVSPIIRLEKNYLCNFQCTHCSAEYYMDRHLKANFGVKKDPRVQMDLEDVRRISQEADDLGLGRFVITGGEPLVMKDFDQVVEAIDPDRHYIITDTNGWFLDDKKAKHLKSIGVEKVQLSLDSFIKEQHDIFRNKKHSYDRVMRAVDASLDADLNLLLSTVLVKGRAAEIEFEEMCKFCDERGIGLYVSYAKPVGSASDHPEFVITKEDADAVRRLEDKYNVFTHMTPSYGSFKGCITVKGIITITNTMEITPCPYIDMSFGNLKEDSLKTILDRGMRNPWTGPHRPDCIIGEDFDFIELHQKATKGAKFLPIPYGEGFTDSDELPAGEKVISGPLLDKSGRLIPENVKAPAIQSWRNYYRYNESPAGLRTVYNNVKNNTGSVLLDFQDFESRIQNLYLHLQNDKTLFTLLKGQFLPFILPKLQYEDYGKNLDEVLLPALSEACKNSENIRYFKSHLTDKFSEKVKIIFDTRHNQLFEKACSDTVCGFLFPALSGYSIPAALEAEKLLPKNVMLSGALDLTSGLVGMPEFFLNEQKYTALSWWTAVKSESVYCEYFEIYGDVLTLNRRPHFDQVSEYFTSFVTILA